MTIDDLVPDVWPNAAIQALDVWRQGHLIRGDLAVWLAAGGVVDPVTGTDYFDQPHQLVAAVAEVGDTGYLAVVSQTCDIAATGPGRRHPFVQVCPVRDVGKAFTPQKVEQIRGGEVVEYVFLTSPPEPAQDWAIDLRASIPMSKGALVGTQPVVGFATEDDELALAGRLAAKLERPALHDYLSKDLLDDLNNFLGKAKKNQHWCDDVEQLRLQVDGPRLAPKRVRLLVVTDIEFNAVTGIAKREPLRNWWKSHRRPLRAEGIEQAPIAFRDVANIAVTEYRNSVPLNLPALGRGTFA